jgi:transposase-like protein
VIWLAWRTQRSVVIALVGLAILVKGGFHLGTLEYGALHVSLAAGRDYPRSYGQMHAWFAEDSKCLDYLDWLRWPDGFVCPNCGSVVGWRLSDGRWKCGGCERKVSATAGTIFDKTRTPLTVWFATAWLMVNSKTGISATQLRREMELGSIQTAWAMLHRYRSVMVRPGRDRLRGDVEVDESYLGGPEPGVPGRGALGKVLFAAAVELDDDHFGRARLGVIPDASANSLSAFLDANVEPGSCVITDGWSAYPAATRDRYEHRGTSIAASGLQAHEVLPAVHRVFSLVKRWMMGTMQGSVSPEHVQAYFDEWVFRFNRRNSRSRGLLFHTLLRQAVNGEPVTYKSLCKTGRTRPAPLLLPRALRSSPPTLDQGRPELPWRR